MTPMMQQYMEIKSQYPDSILMFRLGDFYEMFLDDAIIASEILQITLTARNKNGENSTPMCGIPYHAVQQYIAKLTRAGKKVALCDQVTKPDGKGIVKREVIRVVTPGTTFDDSILDQKNNNFLATVVADKNIFALAFTDVTTGEFKFTELQDSNQLESELQRLKPSEIIVDPEFESSNPNVYALFKKTGINAVFTHYIDPKSHNQQITGLFSEQKLKAFNLTLNTLSAAACAQLLSYLQETQKSDLRHIQRLQKYHLGDYMVLDDTCIRNLELFYSNSGIKKGTTLISILDQTATAMGGRMLRNWLRYPLIDKQKIDRRLDLVESFVKDSLLVREVRALLEQIHDIERLISKLSLGTGNARDLIALKNSLQIIPELKQKLSSHHLLGSVCQELHTLEHIADLIEKSIIEESPFSLREGGMIKSGINTELDELRNISHHGKDLIANIQERERARTGINSLKIKFNKVFGYYLEISKSNLNSVPDDYIRKQTLVNAERFITPELKEYEEKVLTAEGRIKDLEYEIFYDIRMQVITEILSFQSLARTIAFVDVINNFALIAVRNNYCKPTTTASFNLNIKEGRHPVIERLRTDSHFTPNDCEITDNNLFLLITGPNMGGKSTYLRQIAIIVLMAQLGSYVPAHSAEIGIVDRIFTRVGASDNLAAGESTFMVEMTETSSILNNATERSLIILDEIGRGTSTYDGLSIAWAITEYIHNQLQAKTLFATHYHELINLATDLPKASNHSVLVEENQKDGVKFLYKVIKGGVDKSYGIEVAKLAGLPETLIERAKAILEDLEKDAEDSKGVLPSSGSEANACVLPSTQKQEILPLGNATSSQDAALDRQHKSLQATHERLLQRLHSLDTNNLTPIQALQELEKLKSEEF